MEESNQSQSATSKPTSTAGMSPASSPLPKPGVKQELSLIGQEISGCIILEKISEGGMGTVFKAKHKALDRVVCVKVLSPSLADDKKAVGLFLTEARAIAEIDHPNIVFVYNVGKEKGYYFIVMSFIEGESLSSIVRKKPNLPISFVVDTFIGMLRGLEAAHAKGIIHRDIKPSNILINKKLEPKIVDFGIAKKVDKEKGFTKTTELAGTAYFLSPEQALGRSIDTRADLYSIGASLFYVLSGKYPFTGKNSMDIIQKHINEPVPDVSTFRKGVPQWLSQAINKLMAKDPKDRFQTATETLLFFQKMRADDQLRIGQGVNITEEVGLQIKQEDPGTSPRSDEKRDGARVNRFAQPERKYSTPGKASLPVLGGAVPESPTVQRGKGVRHSSLQALGNSAAYGPAEPTFVRSSGGGKKSLIKSIFYTALACAMLIASAALFLKLGALCSAYEVTDRGVIQALVVPWGSGAFLPGQLFWACVCFVFLAFAFSMFFFENLRKVAPLTIFIALWSYIVGLYGWYDPGISISLGAITFLPLYAFVLASIAIKIDDNDHYRLPWRLATIALFALAFFCIYIFLKPEAFEQGALTPSLFYATIGLVSATFVLPFLRGSGVFRFAVVLVFIAACASIWAYQASGNVYSILKDITFGADLPAAAATVESPRADLPPAFTLERYQNTQFTQGEEEYIESADIAPPVPAQQRPPVKTQQEIRAEFIEQLTKKAPKITLAEAERETWLFALKEPFEIFKHNYKQDGFLFFTIIALILYGIIIYLITMFFSGDEERWTLT